MLFAVDQDERKISATPKTEGWCSMCKEKLIPKCGRIVTHHWAHRGEDCDSWREPETEWHRYWKRLVPPECSEVTIEKDGVRHRADIRTKSGLVIELQHSPLGLDEIAAREAFYDEMIWLFDVRICRPTHTEDGIPYPDYAKQIRLRLRPKEGRDGFYTFRWVHPRRSIAYAQSPTYLDIGSDEIFKLEWMSKETPCGGKGIVKPREAFESWLRRQCGTA
jgi:hypothetical protein